MSLPSLRRISDEEEFQLTQQQIQNYYRKKESKK